MNTVQEKWDEYERMVVPVKAGPNQRLETRRGFYAGAFSVLCIVGELPADTSEDAGAMILQGLKEEILVFTELQQQLGATGEYPDGKSREDDEGEIKLAVRANVEKGLIGMEFGKPVAWVMFKAEEARNLAEVLIANAERVERKHGKRTRKV